MSTPELTDRERYVLSVIDDGLPILLRKALDSPDKVPSSALRPTRPDWGLPDTENGLTWGVTNDSVKSPR